RSTYIKLLAALALTLTTLFTGSAFGQTPTTEVPSTDKQVAQAQPVPLTTPDKAVPATTPDPNDLKSDLEAVKAENAVVKEMLRKMEEQQKTLLEQVDRLQRRLDNNATTDDKALATAGVPVAASGAAGVPPPPTTGTSVPPGQPVDTPKKQASE